jgi:DNA-binding transcriptional MerR regulator
MSEEELPLEEPLYNIGVVTRLTGVPITSLHAWERRYGFPQSARTKGGHRLYSEADIARLRWVKTRVEAGMQTRQAIAAARRLEAEGHVFTTLEPSEASPGLPAGGLGANPSLTLMDALIRHDLSQADEIMGELLAFHSPEEITLQVIGPALNAIGEAWEGGRIDVATEHLASNYLRHRLLMWMVTGPPPRNLKPVVLACAPGEWHEGSLLMLGVLLRRRGIRVAYLGQNVPLADLAAFVRQIRPPAIVLVAMQAGPATALAEWPDWIDRQEGVPVVAFAGRGFLVEPGLQKSVPGVYLGSSLQDGMEALINLLPRA